MESVYEIGKELICNTGNSNCTILAGKQHNMTLRH